MTRVVDLATICSVLPEIDLVGAMEEAFDGYSLGRAVVPPVGELLFERPPGEVHIKYGALLGDDVFVVKVATGFYENAKHGSSSTSGLMVVFSQKTGFPLCVLLDEGHLTDVRTAAAGAVAARHLAPSNVEALGVLGTGRQARMQLEALEPLFDTRRVHLWGRRPEAVELCRSDLEGLGFEVEVKATAREVSLESQLIVTTTAATEPLLDHGDVHPGSHITAMGSDTEEKQELSAALVARADVVVADSRSQCLLRGEIHHALEAGLLRGDSVLELGDIVGRRVPGRENDQQITLADLTGVAVQDIAVAKAVLAKLVQRTGD